MRIKILTALVVGMLLFSNTPAIADITNTKCSKLNSIIKQDGIQFKCLKIKNILKWQILKNNQTISFNEMPLTSWLMTSGSINLNLKSSSGLPISIVSKSPKICLVDSFTVSPISAGGCLLVASQPGDKYFNQATLQFSINIFKSPQNIISNETWPTSLSLSKGAQKLSFVSDAGLEVSVLSKTMSICSVSGSDLKLLSIGNCELTATQAGNDSFLSVQKSFSVLLTKTAQNITVAVPIAVSYPSLAEEPLKMKLSPTSSSGLSVSVSTSTPTICSVDGLSVLPIAAGDCVLRFEQSGDAGVSPAEVVQKTVNFRPECTKSSRNTGNGPFLTATCYVGTRSIASPWFGPPSANIKTYEYVGGSRIEMSVYKNSMIFDYYNGYWVDKGLLQFSNVGWTGRSSSAGCTTYSISPSGIKTCQTGSGFDIAVISENTTGLRRYCTKSSLTATYCSWEFDVNWIATDPNVVPIANVSATGTTTPSPTTTNPSPTPSPSPSTPPKPIMTVGEKMQKALSALDKSIYRIQCTVNSGGTSDTYMTNGFAADVTLGENARSRGFIGTLWTNYEELSGCLDANVKDVNTFQAGYVNSGYVSNYDKYNDVALVMTRFPVVPIVPSPIRPQVGDFVMHLAILGTSASVSIYAGYVSNIEGNNIGTDIRFITAGGVLINEDGKWIGIAQVDGDFQKPGLVCRSIVICDAVEDVNRWSG